MKSCVFLFLFFAYAAPGTAQISDTIFFDSKWTRTAERDSARFFRLQQKDGEGYRVWDYYWDGTLQMSGYFRSFDPEIKEDSFKYFHENGKLSSEGAYKNNNKVGIWTTYFPTGEVRWAVTYDDNGMPIGTNAPGSQGAMTYAEVMPVFPGGYDGLREYMVDNLAYPFEARKKEIQGRVVVKFVVDTVGRVRDAVVVQKVHPLLDESALQMVRGMPNWTPGMQNGKKVSVYFTLPVSFRL